jgi:CRISPR-associated endonuclease Csn1
MKVLGLDCGIASIGWAVLEVAEDKPEGSIIACGTYCFEQPIVGGTGGNRFTSTKSARSRRIGHMKFLRRKKQKLRDIRSKLVEHGLLSDAKKDALARAMNRISPKDRKPQITPYDLRADALDRVLSDDEFAVVIGHIALHPGPRSSLKQQSKNEEDERGKIKSAVSANSKYAQKGYRTIGEMLARDQEFQAQKHNREGAWRHTLGRNDLLYELRSIFSAQRRIGNRRASDTLLNSVIDVIERKKEPTDEYYDVGPCRFEKDEPRASSRSYSFERFRFAENLGKLSLIREEGAKPSPDEMRLATESFGTQMRTTFSDLRKLWNLPKQVAFADLKKKDESERDFATGKGESCHGTFALREALGDDWDVLQSHHETLDEIARILTFATREDVAIRDIRALGLKAHQADKIIEALKEGRFDGFVKAAHISAKAARNLFPEMERGVFYSDACTKFNYNHTAPSVNPTENRNPVVRHAVRQYLETIGLVIDKYGVPDEIRLEMARDVAWGAEKRLEETERNLNNRKANKQLHGECATLIGTEPTSFQVLKYRLAKEQGFKSLYSGKDLCDSMRDGFEGLDVDHVLPRSQFHIVGDRHNLVVCLSGENAEKRDDTPYEWSQRNSNFDWNTFTARVATSKELSKRKRRLLLMKSTDEIRDAFKKRNLVDTQYAVRLLIAELDIYFKQSLPNDIEPPPVVGRPGRLVSWLRKGWGIDRFKYEYEKVRNADDRHHALDAIIVAAIDKRTLDVATWLAQQNENSGRPRDRFRIDPPWATLESDVAQALEEIPIVARERKTRFSGLLHKETIYGLTEVDGQLRKRERKRVDKDLTLKDLERFQDSSDKGHIKAILEQWVKDGHPKDRQPTWKYGIKEDGTERRMPIRKITLLTNEGLAFSPPRLLNQSTEEKRPVATYDRAKQMIRVDIFRAEGSKPKSKYLYVPVYPHQMNDAGPPQRAFSGRTDMMNWPELSNIDAFHCSLVLLDLIEVESDAGVERVYFRGLDVDSGRLQAAPLFSLDIALRRRYSPSKILSLKKLTVDRIGRITESQPEQRTWRGKACT